VCVRHDLVPFRVFILTDPNQFVATAVSMQTEMISSLDAAPVGNRRLDIPYTMSSGQLQARLDCWLEEAHLFWLCDFPRIPSTRAGAVLEIAPAPRLKSLAKRISSLDETVLVRWECISRKIGPRRRHYHSEGDS
jgi:hypothetical protein